MGNLFSAEARRDLLSSFQARFCDFVERHPESLDSASYEALRRPGGDSRPRRFLSQDIPIQPWPVLLDSAQVEDLGRSSVQILDLMRSLPERFFDNDAAKLCEHYVLDPELAPQLQRVLGLPWRPGGEIMRGDFVYSRDGLKCIEVNSIANAGGIFNFQVVESYLRVPLLRRFFQEQQVIVRYLDPWHSFVEFMIERALSRSLHREGVLNFGFVVTQPRDLDPSLSVISPIYEKFLTRLAPGVRGKVLFCDYDEMVRKGDVLAVAGGEPVHVLFQNYDFGLALPFDVATEAWLDGIIDLYAGPMGWIYLDKRNLALLSEGAEASPAKLDAQEAAVVRRLIPWTRMLRPGKTSFEGEQVELEKAVLARRERFVLKPPITYGGVGVHIGLYTSPEAWREMVDSAMDFGQYTVQEYLPHRLQPLLWEDQGYQPGEVNWGLFVWGDRFGGGYLRVMPPGGNGLVNVSNGAQDGSILEVLSEAPGGDSDPAILTWPFMD